MPKRLYLGIGTGFTFVPFLMKLKKKKIKIQSSFGWLSLFKSHGVRLGVRLGCKSYKFDCITEYLLQYRDNVTDLVIQ